MTDCFDVLGIARGAAAQDVRRAYRSWARRLGTPTASPRARSGCGRNPG